MVIFGRSESWSSKSASPIHLGGLYIRIKNGSSDALENSKDQCWKIRMGMEMGNGSGTATLRIKKHG